jgi:ABC-type sugar transport system permease subunit
MSSQSRRVDEVQAQGARAVYADFFRQLGNLSQQRWGNLWGYLLVAPALILYIVFQAWPILRGFFMAFSDYRWIIRETHGLAGFNGIANYVELWHDQTFWSSLGKAFKFTAYTTPATLLLALFVALMISKVRHPTLSATYRVISYLPVIIPVSVAMLVWKNIYHIEFGYLNYFLKHTLGIQKPPNWLGSPKWAMLAVAIPTIWKSFGHQALLLLIGIYNINPEMYEAAAIDGAGGWGQFWYITLPLLKPVLSLILVLYTNLASATVEMMVLFAAGFVGGVTGGPADAVLTTGLYLYRTAFSVGDMRIGYAASMSLVLGILNAIFAAIIFKALKTERA